MHLDPEGREGLGSHVHREFGVPVLGVAKTAFRSALSSPTAARAEARSASVDGAPASHGAGAPGSLGPVPPPPQACGDLIRGLRTGTMSVSQRYAPLGTRHWTTVPSFPSAMP